MSLWYERPMRIAALQCNYENGQTMAVIDKWLAAGFNVEQLFHPIAEKYAALFDPAKHTGVLQQYIQQAKSKGLRIILYQNCHILLPSQNGLHADWALQAREGSFPMLYGTYYGCCVNSPWRDYFLGVIDALAPFDLDGLFLDGPSIEAGCYCRHCRARYQREAGGDLLTAAETAGFFTRSRGDFVRDVYRRFKQSKPEALCYWNFPVGAPSKSYADLAEELKCNDIVGTEGGFMFYGPPKDAYLWHPSVAAKSLEAVAPRKARVIFMAADQKPWSWLPHTAVETQLCIASSVANGANVWYGLHGSTALLDTPGGRAAGESMRFLAQHEEVYTGTTSAARIAVLFSFDTERSYRTRARTTDFYGSGTGNEARLGNFSDSFYGCCDLLARAGIAYDVVTDFEMNTAVLAKYDVLCLPTCACLRSEVCDRIRGFVQGGGTAIVSFDTALYDEDGQARSAPALGDVCGIHVLGTTTAYGTFNYFVPAGAHPLMDGMGIPLLPAPAYGLDVEAIGAAEVLARFHQPLAGRYVDMTPLGHPAVILNRFGRGRCVYLGGTFFETSLSFSPPEYRRLILNVLGQFALPVVRLEGGLGNLELVLRRQDRRLIVHLVNYAGIPPRPFTRVAPQVDVRLHVRGMAVRSARALCAGVACRIESAGSDATVYLPDIGIYEVVTLASAGPVSPR